MEVVGQADRERFEALYRSNVRSLLAYVLTRTSTDNAHDVISSVFLVVWRRLDDVPSETLPWLIGVARRVLADQWRSESRQRALGHRLERQPVVKSNEVDDFIDSMVMRGPIGSALKRLGREDREIVILVAWHGFGTAQLAASLGCSKSLASLRLHRARRRFASFLEEEREDPLACGRRPNPTRMGGPMKRATSHAMSKLAQANPVNVTLSWWATSQEDALLDALLAYETLREPNQSDAPGLLSLRRGPKRAAATGLSGRSSPTHMMPGTFRNDENSDEAHPDAPQLITDPRRVYLSLEVINAADRDVSHSPGTRLRAGHRGLLAFSMVAAAVLLVVGLLVFSNDSRPSLSITTSPHEEHVFGGSKAGGHEAGTWHLVDDQLSGTWQQNLSGPPTGYIDCPAASVCYAMSGHYANADTRLVSESLYVTDDVGASWSVLPMPSGFAPTSSLSCASANACVFGGTYRGQPVFLVTLNGGHSFIITSLPQGVGTIDALSCMSKQVCRGVAAVSTEGRNGSIDSTFLSTNDGGRNFTEHPLMSGLYMPSIACSSALRCTVVGTNVTAGSRNVAVDTLTADDGAHWSAGSFPGGFDPELLSCANALDCSVTGEVNPSSSPDSVPKLASTTNGGKSWSFDPIPTDVPGPIFIGLSCPSPKECWVSGSESVSQQIGSTADGSSSLILGTTDGGATWSRVTFSAPQGAPNYDGQSFQSIGLISCAAANVCVALGATARGSASAPVYSLLVPQSG